MTVIEHFNAKDIREDVAQFIGEGQQLQYKATTKYRIIDNDALSVLALMAKNNPNEFQQLVSRFVDGVVIIPEIVFEESIRNLKGSKNGFNNIYQPFYTLLAQWTPIYIVTMKENYDLYKNGFASEQVALEKYKALAHELTDHQDIQAKIQSATTFEDIEAAFRSVQDNCGERISFVYAHVMLAEKITNVRFMSNEYAGVYKKWTSNYAKNQKLHQMIYIYESEYIQAFRVESVHRVLFDYARMYLTPQTSLAFITAARNAKILTKIVRYGDATTGTFYEAGISNVQFNNLVGNSNITVYH